MSRWGSALGLILARWTCPRLLVVGERYICNLDGHGHELIDAEFVSAEEWVVETGDGVVSHGSTTAFRGAWGQRIEVPTERVLWHRDEHPPIVVATRSLGIDLVPPRRRPAPVWRVGAARVGVPGMVELGRLLAGGW